VRAIRNGDTDDNPGTERDATWQPIDITPMHPEYPCAHCIISTVVATAMELALGRTDVPEVVMTSPTAPGVTHRWTDLHAYADEVAHSRIWGRLSLPVFRAGRPGHGAQDRPIRHRERDAAGEAHRRALNERLVSRRIIFDSSFRGRRPNPRPRNLSLRSVVADVSMSFLFWISTCTKDQEIADAQSASAQRAVPLPPRAKRVAGRG
jgi:hypothetical protein